MFDFIFRWHFDPVLFSFGPFRVGWYGLVWAATFILGQQFMQWSYRREKVAEDTLDQLLLYLLIGTVTGARLAHCLIYDPVYYLANPLAILKTWEGGLASHGGAAGLLFALWLYTKRASSPSYLWILDRLSIPAALGGAMIRVANFLDSDIVGRPTSGTWGVIFEAIDNLPRHPVQLYESFAYAGVFILLLTLYLRNGAGVGRGLTSGIFLFFVFFARITLEHFKMPQAAYEADFVVTIGQWLSIPFMLAGIGLTRYAIRVSRPQIHPG